MFAILALLCFVLYTFGVKLGVVLLGPGLAFLTLHLLVPIWPWNRNPNP